MFSIPGLGASMAIATLDLEADRTVLDLDDPIALADRGIRPSRVVTSDRAVSRSWARSIFNEGSWCGVRWWSYYDADWGSIAIWDPGLLRVIKVEGLKRSHPAIEEARQRLHRLWL